MEQRSLWLDILRRPSWLRDLTAAALAGTTLLMPCYAGIPDWWVSRGVLKPGAPVDNKAALTVGQFKHAVSKAVEELNVEQAGEGGAGMELNSLVATWESGGATVDNYEMVNAGQVKAVLKLWYDRLNTIHGTTGYPWVTTADDSNYEAVNLGQLKNLLRLDVRLPWTQNLAQGQGAAAQPQLQAPNGAFANLQGILAARDHYLRNGLLRLSMRPDEKITALPAYAENLPSVPVATTGGEFKAGQDGAANYTVRLQGPKGVANVEPALSLEYSSNGGDGILGLGWSLAGLSVINRGPSTLAVDGHYAPADFGSNDRFYLDGERLVCVSGVYGENDSEYRTLKEQFSKIVYHKSGEEDWFEVFTKAGLIMEFGRCQTACIGPLESGGQPCAHPRTTWAVCKVKDSLGNYWQIIYEDAGPGADAAENTPYLPDYQPSLIRYTGREGRDPSHEIRFIYEMRPDFHRGYVMGFLVRKMKRLCGVEIRTDGTAIRSWRLRYNLDAVNHTSQPATRSRLQMIQEVAGAYADSTAPALPATMFTWDEGQLGWAGSTQSDVELTVTYPGGTVPYQEDSHLQLEHPLGSISYWLPRSAQYSDLDGDGFNEIIFNHRGPSLEFGNNSFTQFEFRYVLKPSATEENQWNASYFTLQDTLQPNPQNPPVVYGTSREYQQYANPATGAYNQPADVLFADLPRRSTEFPYLTTAANVPTGASMVDINGDGLPDIVSSGTFDSASFNWEGGNLTANGTGEVINAAGVWLNQGGTFVKDVDGVNDTVVRKDIYTGAPLLARDNWGEWRFPRVPCEFTASDGGAVAARPGGVISTERTLHYLRALGILQDANPAAPAGQFEIPSEFFSGDNEVLGYPQFALFREHDLGWRFVDMDGDGDIDIIRAGQGYEAAGWLPTASSSAETPPAILGTGGLSARGRQLCFGLRNNGPDAPPGQRWTLINPDETHADGTPNAAHLKSIWKLPLPLVDDNGKLDMGRRLIDLNGDGLPDFLAQKKRASDDPLAPWTLDYFNDYDFEVWINGGEEGWIPGGDAWRLEGLMISWLTSTGAYDIDYGRMLQDMNGDGLPDFVVSMHVVGDGVNQLHEGVFLNNGKGWVKKLDTASGRHLPVNHTSLIPPKPLFYNRVPRPYSLIDMNGDGRPEFLNGRSAEGVPLPDGSKIGRTHFMSAFGGWIPSPHLAPNQDWNLAGDLLAGSSVPLNFTELNGDGIMDILRTARQGSVSKTYFRPGLHKPARITRIINGLGVPMDISYGNLSQLAGDTPDSHYKPGTPSSEPLVSSVTPAAAVVTGYTTWDGTENAQGNGGGTITTRYYYSGLRSHAIHGSLGFASLETRTFRLPAGVEEPVEDPVRQITYFSQDWTTDTVGMPLGGETYRLENDQPILLSHSTTTYQDMDMDAALEAPGKFTRFTYAHTVTNENWSPEGIYLGKTTSVSGYGTSGAEKGMLTAQVVTQDQTTDSDTSDDTSSSTVHEYHPWSTGAGQWRIGQIKKTTVTSNAPGTPSVQKMSEFEYYSGGHAHAGLLKEETIDPGTSFSVTKEHIYDEHGNEVKTLTSAQGMPTLASETWYDASGRFPVASVNDLGHATVSTYDPVRSLVTSATMAFPSTPPGTGAQHSATTPTAPSGHPATSTVYDAWGTAKVTTAPDGLRSMRLVQYFVDSALPRALYYVYEQAEGSPPVITYYDRYHRALLVEKTGFNGETILQERQYDHKGRPVRVSKPYIAGAETPAYTVEEYDAYDRKLKVTAPDGSHVSFAYNGYESLMTNHRGQTQQRLVDMNERLLMSTDLDGHSVTFAYTADGQPRETTTHYAGGASGSTTIATTYNAQRLKASVVDENTGYSYSYYDAYGRTLATLDSQGVYTVLEHDVLGRVIKRWTGVTAFNPAAPAPPTTYETLTETVYDTAAGLGLGKPHTVTFTHHQGGDTHTVTETYAYDSLGRSIGATTVLSGQVALNGTYTSSTTYHSSAAPHYGRVATVTDPGDFTRASVYNDLGFLSEVREGTAFGTLLWQGIAYDAEGRTLEERHGNGLGARNSYHPTRGFVERSLTFRTATGAAVQSLELRVNDLGNVEWRRLTRFETAAGTPLASPEQKVETFTFDSQNRLTASYVTGQTLQSVAYHANGNIASKTGVGDYTYGQGAGPHAVTGVALGGSSRRYTYDAKGRMAEEYLTPSGGSEALLRQVAHTSFDQPQFIQHWGAAALSSDLDALDDGQTPWDSICTLNFYFGPGLQRMIQTKVKGRIFTKTLSLGGYEIRETRLHGFSEAHTLVEKEERSHFGNGARVKRWTATSPTIPLTVFEYSLSDHLGSDSATYDGGGQVQMQRGHLKQGEEQKSERQSYDAWGARRDAESWAPAPGQLHEAQASPPADERPGSNLARGFTGHEMLDDVGLIHMNGRLYDPALGRMCAADPYVQTPENIQNYNRYSYALNNPLSQIDPSGHIIVGLIAGLVGAIVGLVGAVIATVAAFVAYLAVLAAQFVLTVVGLNGAAAALGPMGASLMTAAKAGLAKVVAAFSIKKIVIGAAVGAAQGALQAAVAGGSSSDILKAAGRGAITGAISGFANGIVDGIASGITGTSDSLVHQLGHASVAGGMQKAQGGSFKDGFIGSLAGGGVTGGMQSMIPGMSGLPPLARQMLNTSISAVSGGVASAVTGGKFGTGAWSGAFTYAMSAASASLTETLSKPEYDAQFADKIWRDAYESKFEDGGAILDFMPEYRAANGFAIYAKYHKNGTLYLGFRGTEPLTLADWKANVLQALGFKSYQYEQALIIAEKAYAHTGGNVIFVGHSLGGGLAAAAAYRVGGSAVTYNAAGLSSRYKTSLNPKIHAVFVGGEILSTLQDFTFLPKAAGYRNAFVSRRWWRDPISLHLTSHSPF